jgi:DNA-binding FrmR family transcriptional regulator
MVEEERDCSDILQQMTAIRSATHQASLVLARAYASRCLMEPTRGDMDTMLDQLMATLRKLE